jgi:hypothetical protein
MAKPKLNQIVAVVTGKKTRAEKLLTDAHHGWKAELITGISRTYTPLDEAGEKLPPENKKVQVRVGDVVRNICAELSDFIDVVATQETGNTIAKANIEVDGKVIAANVPISVLLFLEKRLTDLYTFVAAIPTLPTDKEWSYSKEANCNVTPVIEQMRTAKVPVTHVKFQPTEHQPGQAEILYVDKQVGTWATKHFSGAITVQLQSELLARVVKLQDAVKVAREHANSTEVEQVKMGNDLLSFVFGDMIK